MVTDCSPENRSYAHVQCICRFYTTRNWCFNELKKDKSELFLTQTIAHVCMCFTVSKSHLFIISGFFLESKNSLSLWQLMSYFVSSMSFKWGKINFADQKTILKHEKFLKLYTKNTIVSKYLRKRE